MKNALFIASIVFLFILQMLTLVDLVIFVGLFGLLDLLRPWVWLHEYGWMGALRIVQYLCALAATLLIVVGGFVKEEL